MPTRQRCLGRRRGRLGRGTTPKAPVPNRGSRRPTPIPTPPEQPRWRAEEVICPITFRGSWRSPGSSGTIGGGAHDRSRDVLVRSSRKNSSRASSASRISALRAARQTPHSRRCSCGRRLPIRPHRVLRYRGASVRRRVFRPRVHPPAQDQRGRGARHRRHTPATGPIARRLRFERHPRARALSRRHLHLCLSPAIGRGSTNL